MPKARSSIQVKNRRASFDYEFLETYTAGIQLVGTEIKSIRAGKASLQDAYCYFVRGELFVRGMNIAQYHWATEHKRKRCPPRDGPQRILIPFPILFFHLSLGGFISCCYICGKFLTFPTKCKNKTADTSSEW